MSPFPRLWPLVAGVLLVGCQQIPTADNAATIAQPVSNEAPSAPLSPEDAQPYVEDVLGRYLSTTDLITTEGGVQPSRIREVVSDSWWKKEEEGFAVYLSRGERTLGETTLDSLLVQTVDETVDETLDISVFACVDSSQVFVLGRDAASPPEEVLAWHPHYDDFAGTEEERAVIDQYFDDNDVRFGQRQPVVFWLTGSTLQNLVVDSSEQWWGAHPC